MLRPFALAALLLAASAALPACDAVSSGDQTLFEDQAYLSPVGSAPVWRIGPAFDARIRILNQDPVHFPNAGPLPNPAGSDEFVTLQLDVDVAAPGGFVIRRLNTRDNNALDFVASVEGFNSSYIYTFTFQGRRVDPLPGTYRLLVLDANERVVAFGDFTVS